MSPFRDSPSTHRIITHVPRSATSVQCRRQCSTRGAAEPTRELVLSTRRRDARRPLVKMVPGRCGHVSPARRVHFSCRTQYGRVAIVSSSRDRESELPLATSGDRSARDETNYLVRVNNAVSQSMTSDCVYVQYTDNGQRHWNDFFCTKSLEHHETRQRRLSVLFWS